MFSNQGSYIVAFSLNSSFRVRSNRTEFYVLKLITQQPHFDNYRDLHVSRNRYFQLTYEFDIVFTARFPFLTPWTIFQSLNIQRRWVHLVNTKCFRTNELWLVYKFWKYLSRHMYELTVKWRTVNYHVRNIKLGLRLEAAERRTNYRFIVRLAAAHTEL
jgi:hypothetical protein